jgi:hypothetical protein
MYTLTQSRTPARRLAAGRYGENNDATEAPRKPSPPPCLAPVSHRLEGSRCHSTGDFQLVGSAVPRVVSDVCHNRLPQQFSPSVEHQEHQQQEVQEQKDSIVNPLSFYESGCPPQIIHCNLSRASSVSEISVGQDWVFDDSSSGSALESVQKNMVSAEDWEGIIMAVSRPEYETEGSRPYLSKLREGRPGEVGADGSTVEQDDMKDRRRYRQLCFDGGNTSGDAYLTDLLWGQETLDSTCHTQLSPPVRKLSPPPKSPMHQNATITFRSDLDVREFSALDASSLSDRRNNCLIADIAPNDSIFPLVSGLSSPEDMTTSTSTSALCRIIHEANQIPELSTHYSPDRCRRYETKSQPLTQERIARLSDEEMLCMALQASKEEYAILEALEPCRIEVTDAKKDSFNPAEENVMSDRAISFSLEALMVLPKPQRPRASRIPTPELPRFW